MNNSTLVTGADGFIGKAVCALVREQGEEAIFVSRNDCDLTNKEAVRELLQRVHPGRIYHCAGSLLNEFEKALAGNVVVSHNILAVVASLGLSCRVLLLGSAGEYGAIKPEDNPVQETQPLRPVSINGLSKSLQSRLMDFYSRMHGLDIVMARVFNVYGAGASASLFVGRMEQEIARYKRGESATIETGNLESVRDYLSVAEVAKQCAIIMESGKVSEIYNVGSGIPTSMRELLRRMLDEAAIPWEVVHEGAVTPQKFDIPIIYANVTKFTTLIA